jgi:hypothetical protein
LINRAKADFEIDLESSWMIGDRYSDIELARNAGLRSAFVLSGYGRGEWEYQRSTWKLEPDLVCEDLLEAVQSILSLNREVEPIVTELQERLTNIVSAFSQQKLVIIGDAIADKFLYGSISRVSREAPVFILRHEQTETVPGGAANCAINLASLGANVSWFLSSATIKPAQNYARG